MLKGIKEELINKAYNLKDNCSRKRYLHLFLFQITIGSILLTLSTYMLFLSMVLLNFRPILDYSRFLTLILLILPFIVIITMGVIATDILSIYIRRLNDIGFTSIQSVLIALIFIILFILLKSSTIALLILFIVINLFLLIVPSEIIRQYS